MQRSRFLKTAANCGCAAAIPTAGWWSSEWTAAEATNGSPIVFNQLGYLPKATKLVTLRSPSAAFTVRAVTGAPWFCGECLVRPATTRLPANRAQVADISQVRPPGMYILETNTGKSAPFEIGDEVYRNALWLTARGYYGQRCGCSVDLGVAIRIRRAI